MSKSRKIAVVVVLVALLAVIAGFGLKMHEYSTGVDFYNGLR